MFRVVSFITGLSEPYEEFPRAERRAKEISSLSQYAYISFVMGDGSADSIWEYRNGQTYDDNARGKEKISIQTNTRDSLLDSVNAKNYDVIIGCAAFAIINTAIFGYMLTDGLGLALIGLAINIMAFLYTMEGRK